MIGKQEHKYPLGPPTEEKASYCSIHEVWERIGEDGRLEYWADREPYWFPFVGGSDW